MVTHQEIFKDNGYFDKEFSDFYILTQKQEKLLLHKLMLSTKSLYFRNLFKVSKTAISITCQRPISYAALDKAFYFLYTDKLQVTDNSQENIELIEAAQEYQIEGLKEIVLKHIMTGINYESAQLLYYYAENNNIPSLAQSIEERILKIIDLPLAFEKSLIADITFVSKDSRELKLSRIILKAKSLYFSRANIKNGQIIKVAHPYITMYRVLHYIYTGKFDLGNNIEEYSDLIELATEFSVEDLRYAAGKQYMNLIVPENCLIAFDYAIQKNLQEVKKQAIAIIQAKSFACLKIEITRNSIRNVTERTMAELLEVINETSKRTGEKVMKSIELFLIIKTCLETKYENREKLIEAVKAYFLKYCDKMTLTVPDLNDIAQILPIFSKEDDLLLRTLVFNNEMTIFKSTTIKEIESMKKELATLKSLFLEEIALLKKGKIVIEGELWYPLLKACGTDLNYDNPYWTNTDLFNVSYTSLKDFSASAKFQGFCYKPVQILLIISEKGYRTVLKLPQRKPLVEYFRESTPTVLEYISGAKDGVELATGQTGFDFYNPVWRINSVSASFAAFKIRLGSYLHYTWGEYGVDAKGNECSAECAGFGIIDNQFLPRTLGSKSFGVRQGHDANKFNDSQLISGAIILGR